jgi:hypothetical protein
MLKLTEGIDYHIKEVGKTQELTSMTLAGFAAGVIDLTRRSFDINQETVTSIGMLMIAYTVPKMKKSKTKSTKKVVDKK